MFALRANDWALYLSVWGLGGQFPSGLEKPDNGRVCHLAVLTFVSRPLRPL